MNKPDSLRAALTALLPELARDPDRLRIWIDKGRMRCPMTEDASGQPNRDFFYEYTLSLLLVDLTAHPSLVFLAVNDWLRVNQPDLCGPAGTSGYTFEVEVIDEKTIDLAIELPLTEAAVLTPRAGGGWTIEHPPEPDPLFEDELPLSDPVAPLTQVWLDGVQLAP
jgi:P2 phage tail completion protein R (GpR)